MYTQGPNNTEHTENNTELDLYAALLIDRDILAILQFPVNIFDIVLPEESKDLVIAGAGGLTLNRQEIIARIEAVTVTLHRDNLSRIDEIPGLDQLKIIYGDKWEEVKESLFRMISYFLAPEFIDNFDNTDELDRRRFRYRLDHLATQEGGINYKKALQAYESNRFRGNKVAELGMYIFDCCRLTGNQDLISLGGMAMEIIGSFNAEHIEPLADMLKIDTAFSEEEDKLSEAYKIKILKARIADKLILDCLRAITTGIVPDYIKEGTYQEIVEKLGTIGSLTADEFIQRDKRRRAQQKN